MVFVNPFIPLGDPYQPTENYITPGEYWTASTAVDTTTLAPGGGPAQNQAVLINKIAAASGWANRLCQQTLAATVDNETSPGPLRVHPDGTVHVNVKYWPVLQVNSFQVGWRPSQMSSIPNPQDMWMEGRTTMCVPVWGITPGPGPGWFPSTRVGGRLFCQWQYVNGWPNALLTANTAIGATVIPVSNTLGFYVGRQYKLFDVVSGNPETFMCTAVTPGVSLGCTPLKVAHTVPTSPDGVAVSAMPDEMRQAIVFLTSQLIKARGAEAIVLASFGGHRKRRRPHRKPGSRTWRRRWTSSSTTAGCRCEPHHRPPSLRRPTRPARLPLFEQRLPVPGPGDVVGAGDGIGWRRLRRSHLGVAPRQT